MADKSSWRNVLPVFAGFCKMIAAMQSAWICYASARSLIIQPGFRGETKWQFCVAAMFNHARYMALRVFWLILK
jgi:hypothetical protein